MIQIKANSELKGAFGQLIKIMKVNVTWNGIFLIINNNLILPSELRCMFLNLDNKKLTTNVVEVPIDENKAEEILDNGTLTNVINMVLYAFGKWGVISGLKVEKDYMQLNNMFRSILKDVKIEPNFREDNFRFFKEGLQITFEDVIQEVIALNKVNEEDQEEEKQEESKEEVSEESGLGLWHNIRWKTEKGSFGKSGQIEIDTAKSRLGKNFYMVNYECPVCAEKLYMVLYPVDQEFLIETDEARVYLARAYTCSTCNCYYTPRPGKLLKEGDVYTLKFQEDKKAYEDYMELLGAFGTRNANYKFNEYESEHFKKKSNKPQVLEETLNNMDSLSELELTELKDKMDSGFYEKSDVDKYYSKVDEKLRENKNKTEKKEKLKEDSSKLLEPQSKNTKQDFSDKTTDELKQILSELNSNKALDEETKKEKVDIINDHLRQKLKEKYNAHMEVTGRMSEKQLKDLKVKIQAEPVFEEEDKKNYLQQIEEAIGQKEEKIINQKVEYCKDKSYVELVRTMEEIDSSNISDSAKKKALETLKERKKIQGQKEVEQLIFNMPAQMDKKQYEQLCERLHQYKDVDTTPYQKQLDEKYDIVERQDIENLIRKSNKKDRNALFRLYHQIKELNYAQRNAEPFLEKIHDKIYTMDEAAIAKICPNVMNVNFTEGLSAYEKISSGMYLPELKVNMLQALDKRLTKLKMDENIQLVKKLRKEVEDNIKDYSRLYFYDARKMIKGETIDKDKESLIINHALNSYGAGRNKYEMPILIGDSSFLSNGKEGFVLTIDHIFYNSLLSSGVIDIMNVDRIVFNGGIFGKGLYAQQRGRKKVKIPISISYGQGKAFAEVFHNFISYLQEKPESRNIDYLAKDKHIVKCCYRCGYSYKEGNICPKCGYKANS